MYTKLKVIKRSEALKLCQKNLLPNSFSLQITFFFRTDVIRKLFDIVPTGQDGVENRDKVYSHHKFMLCHASSGEAEEEMQMTIMLVVIVIHVFIQGINYLKKRLQHRFFHSLATVT